MGSTPVLPQSFCVPLGKSLNVSGLQLPIYKMGTVVSPVAHPVVHPAYVTRMVQALSFRTFICSTQDRGVVLD